MIYLLSLYYILFKINYISNLLTLHALDIVIYYLFKNFNMFYRES